MVDILTVGYNKGEMDFGISASITNLSQKQMDEFRVMTMVAIGIAEDMWRHEQHRKHPASKEVKP